MKLKLKTEDVKIDFLGKIVFFGRINGEIQKYVFILLP